MSRTPDRASGLMVEAMLDGRITAQDTIRWRRRFDDNFDKAAAALKALPRKLTPEQRTALRTKMDGRQPKPSTPQQDHLRAVMDDALPKKWSATQQLIRDKMDPQPPRYTPQQQALRDKMDGKKHYTPLQQQLIDKMNGKPTTTASQATTNH